MMTAEQQSLMAILRKHYGDTAVLEAISETGSIEAARKKLNRERQIARRKHKQAERQQSRANQVLFRSSVTIGVELAELLASAKRVRTGSLHSTLRATCQRAISFGGSEHGNHHNNLIVLWDLRAGDPTPGAMASCEMLWTGADYRLHFWRRSANDPRVPVRIELAPADAPGFEDAEYFEPQYPIMPPQSAPVPAWADDLSDLRIEKKSLAALED